MTHSIHQIGKDIIVCSDEEINCRDYYIDDTNAVRQAVTDDITYWQARRDYIKIISSNCGIGLPLTNSVENLNQLFEEFESEHEANEMFPIIDSYPSLSIGIKHDRSCFVHGYKRCLGKNNHKIYTIEQMREAIAEAYNSCEDNEEGEPFTLIMKRILSYYQPPIHEGKVLCEITNDSITVTKYL